MTSRGLLGSAARGDALVCRSAVLLFRARKKLSELLSKRGLGPEVVR